MGNKVINNLSEKILRFYRPEIDGLRAFAIIAVVINHFNEKVLPSGYLGVDIFFLISGYVITCSLARRKFENFKEFLAGFYMRRIRRLIPALLFFILIMAIFISLFSPDPRYAIKTSIFSIFGLSNFYLYRTESNYFSEEIELNPFAHTWSLGVEEQFYFIFPLIIWISGFGLKKVNSTKNLSLLIGSISIASLISFIYFYQNNFHAAYFLMPNRIWEMAAGCLVFLTLNSQTKFQFLIKKIRPIFYFLGIIGLMFLPTKFGIIATFLVIIFTALLILTLKESKGLYKFLTLKPILYIGLISYSIYLWHWGILSLSRWTIGINTRTLPIQIILIFLLSVFSYEFIEKPLRTKLNSFSPKKIFIFGIGSIFASSMSIYFLIYKNVSNLFLGKIDNQNRALIQFNDNYTGLSANLCHSRRSKEVSINDKNLTTNCLYLSPKKERIISVIGDSTALAYMSTFSGIAKKWNSSYFHFSKDACSLLLNSEKKECPKDYEKIVKLIKELSSGYKNKYLFISKSFEDKYDIDQKNILQQDILFLVKSLNQTGTKIIITLPITIFEKFQGSPVCRDQWFSNKSNKVFNCDEKINISKVHKHRDFIKNIFELSKNNKNNLYFFDPTPYLCESSFCSPIKEGSYIYQDAAHLSSESKKWLIYPIQNFLENI